MNLQEDHIRLESAKINGIVYIHDDVKLIAK